MNATLVRPDRPAPSAPTATVALAATEARRLLHSPLFWGGVFLAIALGAAWSWTQMPTWDTFAENAGMSSLVLGAAILIATHRATSRDRRAGAEESTRTMPAGPARRGLAMLAAVPIAAAAGATIYLGELLLLSPDWPVGRFDPWAAAAVVVLPAIGAAVGSLIGRLLPGVAAGPLTVGAIAVLLVVLLVLSTSPGSYGSAVWPVPGQPWEVGADRPTSWHLLYLVGVLVAVTAVVAYLTWPKPSVVVLLMAVTVAGLAVRQQARGTVSHVTIERAAAVSGIGVLSCQTHEEVRYCALPRYEDWIVLWREAVRPAAAHLPAGAPRPAVRQIGTIDDGVPMSPGTPEVTTGTSWGRGPWRADSRSRMTGAYVAASVGLLPRDAVGFDTCVAAGQHRTVAGLWLLARATPNGTERLTNGELRLPRVRYGPADVQAALGLLGRPDNEVTGYLSAHWAEVLDPSAEGLAGLGVKLTPPSVPAKPAGPLDDGGVCR